MIKQRKMLGIKKKKKVEYLPAWAMWAMKGERVKAEIKKNAKAAEKTIMCLFLACNKFMQAIEIIN